MSRLALDDPRWAAFVAAQPEALPFHDPAWGMLLADCYGYDAFALAVEERGEIVAGLPVAEIRNFGRRRWAALPFTDECPPLLTPRVAEGAATAALDAARRAAGISRLEVRSVLPRSGAHPRAAGVTHVLPLAADPDDVWRGFHKSQVQRNVKRAEREGVTVRRAESRDDLLDTFYALHLATRRRLGVPIQPRRFFRLLWERVLEPGGGFVLVAEAAGEPAAAAVFLTSSDTVVYKFGASDAAAWPLRPNHALFWHAIRTCCEAGHRRFSFGRTDLDDEGLRAFKRGWGAAEAPLEYSVLGEAPRESHAGGGLSRRVIRRSPAWVCRAVGEVLYPYAA